MALVQQKVPLKLGRLDTRTDPKWLLAGDLVASRNLVFDNWPKLRKRPGFDPIADAPDATLSATGEGRRLATFKGQLLAGTGMEALGYTDGALVDKGPLEDFTISAQAVRRDAYVQSTPDSAVHPDGITVYTWETSAGGAQYSVCDSSTGTPIVSGVSLGANAVKPKPVAIGDYVAVFYLDTALNRIRYVAIPYDAPASPHAAVDFANNPAASQTFDVGVVNDRAFVAYANNMTPNAISIRALTAQLVSGLVCTPATAETFNGCCTVFGDDSNNVWVAFYDAGNLIKVFVYDYTLTTQVLGFTTVDNPGAGVRNLAGLFPAGGTGAVILSEVSAPASYNAKIRRAAVSLAGAVLTSGAVVLRSVGLASKPFYQGGRVHFLVAYQSALQNTYFLAAVNAPGTTANASFMGGAVVVGKLAPGVGGGLTAKSILPQVNTVSASVYSTAYLQTTRVGVQAGAIFSQAGVMAGTFDFSAAQSAVELSDDLHLSGGILWMYDGAQVCEHGFHLYPENLSFTAVAGGGAETGQYQAFAVYEWMDAQGLVHQSAPSPVQTASATAGQGFNYTVQSLRLTSKGTAVNVVFYRTQVNQSVFYRVTPLATPNVNTLTADTVSAPKDTLTDASLGGNAQPYTNPTNATAEVANLAAPAPLHVWRYRNRVAFIPAENPFAWCFSKAFVPGVPVEFNAQQLYQPVSQDGGALTCGVEMDEKNILFSDRRIYYVVGDGPAPNGTGTDYGAAPHAVPVDVGCSNRRSLVLTPQGIMFQASFGKGIYLLDRSLSVSYIGAQVEAYNGSTIVGAFVVPNSRRVLFFTDGGVVLAYDYFADKWSVWENLDGADAVVFQGLSTFITTAGDIRQETPGSYTDASGPIQMGFTTSWLSFAGLQGFQRLYRIGLLGDYRSPHSLAVSVAYDGDPAPVQTETIASSVLNPGDAGDGDTGDLESPGGGDFPLLEYVVKPVRQLCSSVQITVAESQPDVGGGEGLSVSGLTFVVGVAGKGLRPVPVSRSI